MVATATTNRLIFCSACGAREDLCTCFTRSEVKNPVAAALLSCVIPGLGQLYNGDGTKALIYFIGWLTIIAWPLAVMDAYFSARIANLENRQIGLN